MPDIEELPVGLPKMSNVSLRAVLRRLCGEINGTCLVHSNYVEITTATCTHLVTDLMAYAPGMHTSTADVLAVLEEETPRPASERPGTIDPAARSLLAKARSTTWNTPSIPAQPGRQAFQ